MAQGPGVSLNISGSRMFSLGCMASGPGARVSGFGCSKGFRVSGMAVGRPGKP